MRTLDIDAVNAEIAETQADLAVEDDETGLSIPGLETILAFVAVKIVIPVVTGFLGKHLYDKYQDLRSRRDTEAAIADLAQPGALVRADASSIDIEQLRREVVAMAVAEGIDVRLADAVVSKTISRIHERYFRASE
ncbi:hypothetical protein GCM10009555_059000 [Acrocarpospora macrocephala]|uniref:Uncharacterized protein n=1 Tax=Acrocarpospora macrocephala TaxID=150177 RepID=A0A5M3WRC9_9ACTN|nr:hypothetical protein [Acrocarpospora macrocephala]GES11875.1 hypothetical protein Amac_054720 [Acrocarpospora macrocephala]